MAEIRHKQTDFPLPPAEGGPVGRQQDYDLERIYAYAHMAGRLASWFGLSEAENPYHPQSLAADYWLDGFRLAAIRRK